MMQLKAHLTGVAAAAIDGLPLDRGEYETALELLGRRFGNRQAIIDRHLEDLTRLPPVRREDSEAEDVCLFLDCALQNVRSLSALGTHSSSYRGMLLPLILERIPNSLRVMWYRRPDADNAFIEAFLSFLEVEVTSREMANRNRPLDGSDQSMDQSRRRATYQNNAPRPHGYAAALAVRTPSTRLCPYDGERHHPNDCLLPLSRIRKIASRDGLSTIVCKEVTDIFRVPLVPTVRQSSYVAMPQ